MENITQLCILVLHDKYKNTACMQCNTFISNKYIFYCFNFGIINSSYFLNNSKHINI